MCLNVQTAADWWTGREGPGGEWAETQHGSLDLRLYPSSQSELGERELRRTRRAKICIYQFYSTFSLVFVWLFFLRQKCFRRCLGVCSWRCCVRWLPGLLQTKTVRRLQFPPNFTEEKFGRCKQVLK